MPAPVLNQLALEHAREKVAYLSSQATDLARKMRDLEDAVTDCHAALRDAAAVLRAMREASDVPAGVE